MNDFHDITPRPKRGSNGTYFVDPIDEKHGKMRGKSVPADKSTTFVNRFHDYSNVPASYILLPMSPTPVYKPTPWLPPKRNPISPNAWHKIAKK